MVSNFSLVGVESGWLKALFYNCQDSILLNSTDIGGHDIGKQLIDAVCSLWLDKSEEENICFNEEKTAHLLKIRKTGCDFSITIYKLLINPFVLLGGISDFDDYIKKNDIIFEITGEFRSFAINVFMEFFKYNCKDLVKIYEINWFEYPRNELDGLKKLINIR